jgi:hypothetical protein
MEEHAMPEKKPEDRLDDTVASPLEPAAVRGAQDADERDDLPDADADTKQAEKDAKASGSK